MTIFSRRNDSYTRTRISFFIRRTTDTPFMIIRLHCYCSMKHRTQSEAATTTSLSVYASLLLLIGALGLETIGFRSAAAQETPSSPSSSPPVTLQTDNQSVTVLVNWSPQEIQPGQEVQFMLDFQHPFSGESLPHVNYNFEILDTQGNIVESMTNLHTHAGNDI